MENAISFVRVVEFLDSRGCFRALPDEAYLKLMYRIKLGKRLSLEQPRTFNEKLQWLKLYDRDPEYTRMVDKEEAKRYAAARIGEEHMIPTLGVWDRFEDIDLESLPARFVLKCTHDSGSVVLCRDKSELDVEAAKKKLERALRSNYYWRGREWPYRDVKPRILAEQYMSDGSGGGLKDYKLFCFDGVARVMLVASDRQAPGEETKFDFFDMDFHHLPFTNGHPNAPHEIGRPRSFEEMKELAGKLADGIPQVRVDLYEVDGRVYFGELTFFHWSGMVPFEPGEWDGKLGEWIELPGPMPCKHR